MFKDRLASWIEDRWRETGLAFGGRGWAYVAEGEHIITKGQFKSFETLVANLRKDGLLDPDAVADDEARAADYVEYVDDDDPDAYAADALSEATTGSKGTRQFPFSRGSTSTFNARSRRPI